MTSNFKTLLIVVFISLIHLSAIAQDKRSYAFIASAGSAYNLPSRVTVEQDGYDKYSSTIKFKPENYNLPPYYDLKFETWKNDNAWGIRLTHLKLVMEDDNEVFSAFQISHGFNLVNIYRKWGVGKINLSAGAGITIAHPEGEVRGKSFKKNGIFSNGEYKPTLPNLEVGISKRLFITDWLFLSPELRFTGSYAKLSLPDGHVRLVHFAGHATLGIGFYCDRDK